MSALGGLFICFALLVITLFTPLLPQTTEQWLTTLLLGLLIVLCLVLIRGYRCFMMDKS